MYPFTLTIEAICFLLAIFLLKNDQSIPWKYFTVYMFITVLAEASGWMLRTYWHANNQWVYNIFAPIQAGFLYWVFYRIYPKKFNSKIFIGICVAIFVAIYIFECFKHPFTTFNNYSWIFFSFSMIAACGLYYYFLLADDEYKDLATHCPFWFVTGVFVYFFSSSVCTLFFTELMRINIIHNISLRYLLFILFNFILYGCWSYAFLCRYKQTRSS